ncbi:MAG: hypothetical protein J5497_05810 [Selenomonadaceae bacterium]|nr:hypothetical protein [Selenomonadaceae bacterium]
MLKNFGDIMLRVPIDKNFINAWVNSFVRDSLILPKRLQKIFDFDDVYGNTFHGNALNLYINGLDQKN